MKLSALGAAAACLLALGESAHAASISKGGSLTGVSVAGADSIYQIFGHAGDPGGDYAPADDAVLITFSPGGGNVFTFSATGEVGCCSNAPYIPPDGGAGAGMNVVGANGLSSLSGNSSIPLVGVFTTDTDPFGSAAPAALSFNANSPSSLSPLLDQVFYIGDGKSGFEDASGSPLTFTAPTNATRLYLGAIDGYSFVGESGYYSDNAGQFTVDVHLAGVPEPATWAVMLLGVFGTGAMLRSRRAQAAGVAA